MSDHLTAEQRDCYRARTLSPQELIAVDSHLATCEECREQLTSAEDLRGMFRALSMQIIEEAVDVDSLNHPVAPAAQAWPTPRWADHLSPEALAASLMDTLEAPERERIERHLQSCPQCAAEQADLRAFQAEMSTYPAQEFAPLAPMTFRERLRAWWRVPVIRGALPVTAGATLALLLYAVAFRGPRTAAVSPDSQHEVASGPTTSIPRSLPPLSSGPPPENISSPPISTGSPRLGHPDTRLANNGQAASPHQPPQAVTLLHDGGGSFRMAANGQIQGPVETPKALRSAVKQALTGGVLETTSTLKGPNGLIGGTSTLAGSAEAPDVFHILSPVGTVVADATPTFRWQPARGATNYSVEVMDISGPDPVTVQKSDDLHATSWTPTEALPRGKRLRWLVTAHLEDGSSAYAPNPQKGEADARLEVLTPTQSAEVESAKRSMAGSHLMLGLLYSRYGLLDDAEAEFTKLRAENADTPAARKRVDALLAHLKKLRQAPAASEER